MPVLKLAQDNAFCKAAYLATGNYAAGDVVKLSSTSLDFNSGFTFDSSTGILTVVSSKRYRIDIFITTSSFPGLKISLQSQAPSSSVWIDLFADLLPQDFAQNTFTLAANTKLRFKAVTAVNITPSAADIWMEIYAR